MRYFTRLRLRLRYQETMRSITKPGDESIYWHGLAPFAEFTAEQWPWELPSEVDSVALYRNPNPQMM